MTEEEVHGCTRINVDEEDEEDIATEGNCGDHHNHREQGKISLAMRRDSQEDEAIYRSPGSVVPSHLRTWAEKF